MTATLPAMIPELGVLGRIGAEAGRDAVVEHLRAASRSVRRRDIQLVHDAGLGHIGGEYSVTDILVTLYLHVLNVTPETVHDPERDRLILSKGHAAAALYTTLAVAGFLSAAQLRTFMQPHSALNGHPAATKIDAVEASTGPLGHGLPIGVGTALAGRMDGSPRRTFVVLGDGELQEGSNWEAFMAAAHHRLDRLVAVVDRNRLQQGARVADTNDLEPLSGKLTAFGWHVSEVDGHDHAALLDALAPVEPDGRPRAVIAHTDKGYPVSYMRDHVDWHHKVPTSDDVRVAHAELEDS